MSNSILSSSYTDSHSTSTFFCSSTSSTSRTSATFSQSFSKESKDSIKTKQNATGPIIKLLTTGQVEDFPSCFLSFLVTKDLTSLSRTCIAANHVVLEYFCNNLGPKIRNAHEALQEIVAFDPVDENLLSNGSCCAEIWTEMVRKIKADSVIRKIFETTSEDFEKTAQAVKDRDLLICCKKYLPQRVVQEIEKLPLLEQAPAARAWIREHLDNPIFSSSKLFIGEKKLRIIPMEFISKFGQLEQLFLDHNNIQVIPNSMGILTHLQYLDLSYNQIRAVPETLPPLDWLYLDNNQMSITAYYWATIKNWPSHRKWCFAGTLVVLAGIIRVLAVRYLKNFF